MLKENINYQKHFIYFILFLGCIYFEWGKRKRRIFSVDIKCHVNVKILRFAYRFNSDENYNTKTKVGKNN